MDANDIEATAYRAALQEIEEDPGTGSWARLVAREVLDGFDNYRYGAERIGRLEAIAALAKEALLDHPADRETREALQRRLLELNEEFGS